MQTILVGTDFGEASGRAFALACEMAQSMDHNVHLLHVVEKIDDEEAPDPDTQEFYATLTDKSKAKLQAELETNTRGIRVTCSVEIGHRAAAIHQVAESMNAKIVVLGSQPRTADSQRLGVSHCVALVSTRPVLLVP